MINQSVLYGRGVFTTIAIVDGEVLLWEKHWRRLCNAANVLAIDISAYSEEQTRNLLKSMIEDEGLVIGRARLTFLDETPSTLWPNDSPGETKLNMLTGGATSVPDRFLLTASPFTVNSGSPLAGIKSCNYLEQILSLDEAKGRGFHEAVRVNERGHVTSGCMSNIFWLKNGRLYTPTLATGCLAGTTREYVLENVECGEVEAEIGELESADAIYLTSGGLGIVRVDEFGGRELPDTKHPIQNLWPPS